MEKQKKPFQSIDDEIQILQNRGLCIPNLKDAEKKLLHNNYYTIINGYKYPFLKRDKPLLGEQFKEGTTFDEIFSLFEFDCQFRALLLKYILRIEHQLKSVISHVFADIHQDIPYPNYLDEKNFDLTGSKRRDNYNKLCKHIETELRHQLDNGNPMLVHYMNHYGSIPPWILMSVFSFGMVRSFYYCLNQSEQNKICRYFNLRPDEMTSYLSALNTYRNSCAHDERIYSLPLKNKAVRNGKAYNTVYVVVLILKDMLDAETFMAFYSELESYINTYSKRLQTIDFSEILNIMGIPVDRGVRESELGHLESGSALSPEEFRDVLKRYILPILPVSAQLQAVEDGDPERSNPRRVLVEYQNDRLYFAQSTTGDFSYCAAVPNPGALDGQVEVLREHLATFIDYIHKFWNLGNLTAYDRDKVEIAFPNLCEQAYELTICSLLCKDVEDRAKQARDEAEMHLRRMEGTAPPDVRGLLRVQVAQRKMEYEQAVKVANTARQSLYKILNQIEIWANKTYEGQKKTFGIIFSREELPAEPPSFNYIDFLKSDYSATINDGLYSAVELYADGSFKAHISVAHTDAALPSIPYPFTGFADLCTADKVGVLLTASGDILMINDRKLCYTKHGGFWLRCGADSVIERLRAELADVKEEDVSALYQTITDLSYSRGGACIGIIQEDTVPPALHQMIEGGLLSVDAPDEKRAAIRGLIERSGTCEGKSFYRLDRHLRRELLELDGAMVFSKSGLIHVIGTIIKLNDSGSAGGGRTAAAMQLSEFGLAVKISQDGYVQLFKAREKILEILT